MVSEPGHGAAHDTLCRCPVPALPSRDNDKKAASIGNLCRRRDYRSRTSKSKPSSGGADNIRSQGINAMAEIRVPTAIKSDIKLSIGRWFKQVGDPVSRNEPVVEIDTDNVTHEIRAPVTGMLSEILVSDGGQVERGALIGTITEY
jgi:biotin carboxyl carrier protein